MFVTPPPSVSAPGAVETTIAGTAAAAQTQTAINIPPSKTPTITPLATGTTTSTPTPTATILLITETSVPEGSLEEAGGVATESSVSGLGDGSDGKGVINKEKEWSCITTSKRPAAGTVYSPGDTIRVVWTVENNGTQTWPKHSVDIVYYTGAHLHEGKPYLDIPRAVAPGGSITIVLEFKAPKQSGDYGTRWTLMIGKTYFCPMKISIKVK